VSDDPGTIRAGFAALIGRPNVGKSTLLNALIGQKLSIVTPRPQTTRHRVLGVLHRPGLQIAFVDTPGLHGGARRSLNKAMNKAAAAAAIDADVVVWLVEVLKDHPEDDLALQRALAAKRPVIAVVNKVDLARPRSRLLPYIAALSQRAKFVDIVPLSAARGDNLEPLVAAIAAQLPESPPLFPQEMLTDRDLRFRVAEVVREKLTLLLNQELPYGIAVEVERLERDGERWVASCVIWVDREGQKPIVIGKGGERLKKVGTLARRDLNRITGERFHLELWVKVREGWADDVRALRSLGLE
jgi:GTP-binding protein Era